MARERRTSARTKKSAEPNPELIAHPDAKGSIVRPEGSPEVPLDEFKNGKGFKLKSNGEEFGLQVRPDDPQGDTHHLKNAEHYWSGSEREFKDQFEKA